MVWKARAAGLEACFLSASGCVRSVTQSVELPKRSATICAPCVTNRMFSHCVHLNKTIQNNIDLFFNPSWYPIGHWEKLCISQPVGE